MPPGSLPSLSPAYPAFRLLFCPPSPKGKDIPPTRARRALFPSGEGGDSKIILPGATAPGTPALNRLRHVQPLPCRSSAAEPGRHWGRGRTTHPVGGLPLAVSADHAAAVPAGGLPSLSPATPAFSLLCCPHPPTRARRALFPAGRGRLKVYFAGGFAPGTPALNRLRHVQSLSCWCPEASLAGNRFLSVLRRTMGSAPGMQGAKPLA